MEEAGGVHGGLVLPGVCKAAEIKKRGRNYFFSEATLPHRHVVFRMTLSRTMASFGNRHCMLYVLCLSVLTACKIILP
jgi:hypothetical protein